MSLSNILLIPGVGGDLQELRGLLFGNGQAGWMGIPSLDNTAIAANTLGSGIGTFRDLYLGNNGTQATADQRSAWGRVPKSGRRNLLLATATLSTQNVTVSAVQHTLSFRGTGTITLSGTSTAGPLVGTGANDIVSLTFTPTAGTLTLTVSGTVNDAQLNTGASRGNYQTVTTAFDITEPGQRDCYYLRPDGLDDGYATPSIDFTGTDKITVFASLRKLSDAAIGQVVSNVNSATIATGRFWMTAPGGATSDVRWIARELTGGSQQQAIASVAANNNFIVTGQTDGNANNHSIRLNGSLIQTATGDLGTGNFRAGALQLLRNNLQPDSPFNGQCFALIVAGGSYSTATIQRVEQILSKYTPGVTL